MARDAWICEARCSTLQDCFQTAQKNAGWNASTPRAVYSSAIYSDEPLVQHCIGNLEEATDVGAID